jgi:hypothetical protein
MKWMLIDVGSRVQCCYCSFVEDGDERAQDYVLIVT